MEVDKGDNLYCNLPTAWYGFVLASGYLSLAINGVIKTRAEKIVYAMFGSEGIIF